MEDNSKGVLPPYPSKCGAACMRTGVFARAAHAMDRILGKTRMLALAHTLHTLHMLHTLHTPLGNVNYFHSLSNVVTPQLINPSMHPRVNPQHTHTRAHTPTHTPRTYA